ncbi:YceI family protein [Aquabacterium sp. OR-4]|uniref:YceI family protein n=1 Tax=Aquabacterium sp. OR-4 TaxID=2978127 RepID=UPI0021B3F6A9|nr:YceI family protein [Aquabacterium sp. OR-4]MDT7837745.1 YceI family protein [Aquabacterium sp. OR-4]
MTLARPLLLLGLGLLSAGTATAQPVAYQLDPTHSFVHFEVLHFDTATLRGRFGPLKGEVELDRAARRGRVQVVVDVSQVSSGLPVLDARLRGPDLLDAEGHPQAFFVASGFEFDAQGGVRAVRGEFTLRGQGRPLTLMAERFRCYTHPLLRREVCGGDFSAVLERSAWGITYGLPFVAERVTLRVQVEAVRQDPP